MTDELKENLWAVRIADFRGEPVIQQAIISAKKFKIDMSLVRELSGYFPHLESDEKKTKQIRGPADLQEGLVVADKMLVIKDRASHVILVNENYKGKLERLHSIVRAYVLIKPAVMALKNDSQRSAVVSQVCPEVEEKLSRVGRVLDAAHRVVSNTNQSYNILKTQVEIIKEMMYEGGLTKATRNRPKMDMS